MGHQGPTKVTCYIHLVNLFYVMSETGIYNKQLWKNLVERPPNVTRRFVFLRYWV